MSRAILLSAVLASILALGAISAAEAAQLEANINPDGASKFDIQYLITVSIPYGDGQVADMLRGDSWKVTASTPAGSADAQAIAAQLNRNIVGDGSQAQVANLEVDYEAEMIGRSDGATIDYKITIAGDITNHLIRAGDGPNPTLIEAGWVGMTIQDPVIVDGIEINYPISAIESQDPDLASLIAGSPAEDLLRTGLINADEIRDLPLDHWEFLFDPTGVIAGAKVYGIDEDIAGFVVSQFTTSPSNVITGRNVEQIEEAAFAADTEYIVRTTQSPDSGSLIVIGFAERDSLDGVQILGISPTATEGTGTLVTDFPIAIIYGMAGVAAVGGVAFFAYSSRQMKKEEGQGQSGIDPSRLVGYQTSSSAGGYQTNRGEAQLRDAGDYQQTRSVYEADGQTPPPPKPAAQEAACGCTASADMGSECDCQMQGSCLCDADCGCGAQVCRDHTQSF